MIDISIVWQKIKLVFSFLKFPKWFYEKALFYYRCYKFKKLPKDKQEFLFAVFENDNCYKLFIVDVGRRSYGLNEKFYTKNRDILKILEIDGIVTIVTGEDFYRISEDETFNFEAKFCCITPQYLTIVQKFWRKKQEKYFKTTKINYNTEDDIPF